MPLLASSDKCYGCAACSNVCPKKCIEMRNNEYGELRPVVDLCSCVSCGQCSKICAALKEPSLFEPLDIYAMTISDENHKKGCASGGAARLFYEEALTNDSVVFGCDFDENHILRMRSASEIKEIEGFRSSKYTFCRMNQCYNEIKDLLQRNIHVLFIGSSCQVYALKCFLGNNQNGLITVDLVCHGVPPEGYFYEYVQHQSSLLGKKIEKIKFREDEKNEDFRLRLYSEETCIYDIYARDDPFFAGYVNCAIFEERCYNCPFADLKRISDISIGDWGGPSHLPASKLSLILVNSKQGQEFIRTIMSHSDALFELHTLQEAIKYNEQLRGVSPLPTQYFEMRKYYKENGFMMTSKKYIQPYIKSYHQRIRNQKIRRLVLFPFRVLRKIKRMVIEK